MFSLRDYSEETKYVLGELSFRYKDGIYRGRGMLTWRPDAGFDIEGFPEREGGPLKSVGFGFSGPIPREMYSTVLMRFHPFRAITPPLPFVDRIDVLMNRHFSENVPSLVLNERYEVKDKRGRWVSALYEVSDKSWWFDPVQDVSDVWQLKSPGGWKYEAVIKRDESGASLVGLRSHDKRQLELYWELSAEEWSARQLWRLPEAAGTACSLLLGDQVRLLQRNMTCKTGTCTEIRQRKKVRSLSILAPLQALHEGRPRLDVDLLAQLTSFLLTDKTEAALCRDVFYQILASANVGYIEAKELFLGTTLEAMLRTAYDRPFRPGGKALRLRHWMGKFQQDYLSPTWQDLCDAAIAATERLRHRNAHPDWIAGHGASFSEERLDQSFGDRRFLSAFFGFVILALAGVESLPLHNLRRLAGIDRSREST